MKELVLKDKDIYPTEEVIFSHINKSRTTWNSVFKYVHTNHPELNEEWRYYNDGKSWLLKVTNKTKTIFWLEVVTDAFRITFYLARRQFNHFQNNPFLNSLIRK